MTHPSMSMNPFLCRHPGLLVLLSLLFIAPGLAQAQDACRLADPNSLGEFVSEICWFQFGDVDTDLPSGTIDQPFAFDLPDGSSIELDLSVSGGGGQANPRLTVREAPTWTGSNFSGTSDFYTILTPNAAALHSPDGRGHQVVLTLSNVTLLRPDGTEVVDLPYQLIVADAERLNSNPEYLDFGVISGGSEWELLEWLGNAPASAVSVGTPGSLDPGVASACDESTFIDCLRFKGETASSDANAPVLATSRDVTSGDPFNIMGQIHSQAGQGFALGLRWGSVRLRKVLPDGRIDPSDQFVYRIENVVGTTVQTGETTGAGDEYPFISTMAMPGNFLTLIEEMAPGSASTLDQYDSHIVCIDEYGEGDIIVDEPYDATTPPEITTNHLGDGIDCTITNTPRTVDMTFEKSADPMGYNQVGDSIEYSFTVTNNGTVELSNVAVDDPLLGGAVACTPTTLLPTESATCGPVVYTVTQNDIDNGEIFNMATATALDPDDEPVEEEDEITVPGPVHLPALAVVKALTDAPTPITAGSVLEFTVTLTNTGNVTLFDVDVNDPLLAPNSITCASVAPLDTCELVGEYAVTQGDMDAGEFLNFASGNGTPPSTIDDPDPDPIDDDDELTTPLPQDPGMMIEKVISDLPDPVVPGAVIEYTITATNTGNVTLDPVIVEDTLISPSDITCNNVAPGGTCVLVGTYELTQQDFNDGVVFNTATGSGTPPTGDPLVDDDEISLPLTQSPAMELVKSANPEDFAEVGDIIDYSFTVENTGNVTLTDVSVDDPMLGGAVACTPTTLDPGETANCGPVSYTVTQSDIDNGEVINFATATALDPDQNPLDGEDELTVPGPDSDPGIQLLKEAELIDDNGNGFADPGEVIEYTLTATNTGNVTLLGVAITDDLISPLDCTPIQPATLAPGEMLVCTGSYTVTQDDADAGTPVINQATAEGTPPATPDDPDPEPVEDDDSTSTPVTLVPELTLLKEAVLDDTNGNGSADPGEVIEYTLTATNTGNLLLEGVEIEDPMLDNLDCVPDQPATLDVGEVLICTGSYTVTQADADAGGTIANHATVTAPDPTDPDCSPGGDPDACDMIEDDDEEEVPLSEHDPSLVLIKSADPMSYSQVGDVVSYSFTLENSGNVTLFDVMVNDPMLGGDIACVPDELAPGETASCGPVAYTVTQNDIDNGQIINLATGSGTPPATDQNPDPDPVSDEDEVTVPGPAGSPGLNVVKSMTDAPDPIVVGSVLTYTVTATNTGTVSLSDVVVEDTLVTPSSATCPTLAVGESCVLEGIYTVTQSDIDNGEVVNVGTASGNPPGGEPPVSDEDDVTTPIAQTPLLGLVKEAELIDENDNGSADAGEVIEYTLTATNTGNVTLTDVTIDDPMIGVLSCTPAQPTTLPPAGMLVCTGTYVVTQADVDSGEPILNVATVSSPDPIEPSNPPLQDEDNVATPVTSGVDVPAPLAVPLLSPYSLTLLALLIMLIGGTSVRMRVR